MRFLVDTDAADDAYGVELREGGTAYPLRPFLYDSLRRQYGDDDELVSAEATV